MLDMYEVYALAVCSLQLFMDGRVHCCEQCDCLAQTGFTCVLPLELPCSWILLQRAQQRRCCLTAYVRLFQCWAHISVPYPQQGKPAAFWAYSKGSMVGL